MKVSRPLDDTKYLLKYAKIWKTASKLLISMKQALKIYVRFTYIEILAILIFEIIMQWIKYPRWKRNSLYGSRIHLYQ